ncbi:MAG: nicotinate phosphoribosyltransferase [Alphaproteobacteria bacterium]|nr:nicotinate phosphoribosyltransferase [Alphaproteobacteria bacterium]
MNILAQLNSSINEADSYKVSHYRQYPEGTTHVSSYIEARKSAYAKEFGEEYNYALFFGLQAFIKDHLAVPITQDDIDLAELLFEAHGEPFNKEGWQYILDTYEGRLPVEIRALPEGTVAPVSNAMVEVINTDSNCAWLTSYIETAMLRGVWYTTTVATQSRISKDIISGLLDETSDHPESIDFMLHDFGARGVSSTESAALGGMSHLVSFLGTDTVSGMIAAMRYYDSEYEEFLTQTPDNPKRAMIKLLQKMKQDGRPVPAFSVEASEHSTMTIKGPDGEIEQIKNMIEMAKAEPEKIVSIVSDSYDYFHAVGHLYGEKFKNDILEAGKQGSRVVIRPDSGDPVATTLQTFEILADKYADEITTNSKGYKTLPDCLRILWGDGIDPTGVKDILEALKEKGWSAENMVFGMGGGLLQKLNRDTLGFAMKASYAKINGKDYEVYKDPKTGKGAFNKKSKRGRLATIWNGVAFQTKNISDLKPGEKDLLGVVYRNGKILRHQEFSQIRDIANHTANLYHNPPSQPIKDPFALKAD